MRVKLFLVSMLFAIPVYAVNLMAVYQQAFSSDPLYQQAISQRFVTQEGVPISLSSLLPSASVQIVPSINKFTTSGPASLIPDTNTQRGYVMTLNIAQTIFDFSKFAGLAGARALSQSADATLSAATQSLMLRVAKAYFQILADEDNLTYLQATRTAFKEQLDLVREQYKVGLKTITDVYTARASYEGAIAGCIGAENTLADDKENLRVITGEVYPSFARLREDFPFTSPHPANINAWVTTAGQQNWSIKADQYAAEAARQNIKQQFAGHFPTLNAAGSIQVNRTSNSGNPFVGVSRGSAGAKQFFGGFTLGIPLVQGGLVVAQTAQAQYQYQVATQKLEQTLRDKLNLTRQSYLGIMAGISKISADKQSIKSAISSLEGMKAGYRVGTQILFNVLDQQQKVFAALREYTNDKYEYIINLLSLKEAAGTLNQQDLEVINSWLTEKSITMPFFRLREKNQG